MAEYSIAVCEASLKSVRKRMFLNAICVELSRTFMVVLLSLQFLDCGFQPVPHGFVQLLLRAVLI